MNCNLNRREYLERLMRIGPRDGLPIDLATATDAEVDAQWEAGVDLFEVDEDGMISVVDPVYSETPDATLCRAFDSFSNTAELVDFMLGNSLHHGFAVTYDKYYAGLIDEIKYAESSVVRKVLLKLLAKLPEGEMEGCIVWLEVEPSKAEVAMFDVALDHLEGELDRCNELVWKQHRANAQSVAFCAACLFLMGEGGNLRDNLSVYLADGWFQGSKNQVVGLRVSVEEANALAKSDGLPIRFRKATLDS